MWKSSPTRTMEDEKRDNGPKISHISKYPYKTTDSGTRDREYQDNHYRKESKNSLSRQKSYSRDYPKDHRHSEKRYNDSSSMDDKYGEKSQKRKHNYSDYDHHSDKNYDDQGYSSRKKVDKYKSSSHIHKSDYKSSKRSHHSPDSPYARYSPYKNTDKTKGYRGYERSKYNSPSPRTPPSDMQSSQRNRFSPPPLPPFEPPVNTKVIVDNAFRNKQVKYDKNEPVHTFAQFYETKRYDGKYKEYGPDPRLNEQLYGSKLLSKFEHVNFPKNPNVDTTLDSPVFTLDLKFGTVYSFNHFFQTPLERINNYLFSSRPKIDEEWWLKGTLSLLLFGIPRNWTANEVLAHLVDSHNKITLSTETLSDEWQSDSDIDDITHIRLRKSLKKDCKNLGITKFFLLFGDSNVAVNEIPLLFPRNPDTPEESDETSKRFVPNDQPGGMGLLLFDSEEYALKFWSILGSNLIQAYPSTMRLCPDPSGWRIYSEALSFTFQNELLNASPSSFKDKNDTIDLLSVLTTPNSTLAPPSLVSNPLFNSRKMTESPGNRAEPKGPKNTHLMFVCSYICNQDQANMVAKNLNTLGIKCMYHKPSKIMSLQFPDEKTLHSISFGHKVFTTNTGSRVQCCFIRCDGKAIPILKRANVEHLSNSYDKKKNLPFKPSKFKPPLVGIVDVEELNE